MNRREYLAGTSLFGITATAGCLEWVFPDDDEDEDAEAGGNTHTDGAGDDGGSDEDEQNDEDENEPSENGEDGTDEHEDSNDGGDDEEEQGETGEGEESDEEEDEEDELVPDREDVEPDRDEYDEPEDREAIERDSDDVSVDASAQEDDGLIVISGSVTNVSDEFVDAVNLRFELYGSGDEYIGGRLVSVQDIDAGTSVSFEEEIWADELRGALARIEIGAVEVFDFLEDDGA